MARYHTALEVEREFKALETRVLTHKRGGTNVEDVLRFMYENPHKIWWMSWEFVGQTTKDGKLLSHKAPARASDLAIFDPQLVEDRKISRFKAYRMRTENMNLIEKRLGLKVTTEKPQQLEERCQHGLPTYVQCPDCKK